LQKFIRVVSTNPAPFQRIEALHHFRRYAVFVSGAPSVPNFTLGQIAYTRRGQKQFSQVCVLVVVILSHQWQTMW